MSPAGAARWRAVCLLMLVAFLALSLTAYAAGLLPGDAALRRAMLPERTDLLYQLAGWANYGGSWQVLLPGTLIVLALSPVARRHWWLWCAVLAGSGLVEDVFKVVVGRPRPSGLAPGFPSGHTTAATAFAVVLLYLAGQERLTGGARRALQVAAILQVALVGWARIVLRAHWPSDVLGGILLGTTCAAAAAWWDLARNEGRRGPDTLPGPDERRMARRGPAAPPTGVADTDSDERRMARRGPAAPPTGVADTDSDERRMARRGPAAPP
jgi:undecaprenyl-diphosphatase